jgi:hypothetical protein
MKRASALLKNCNVYIQSYSETTSGVWIADGPVHIAGVDAPAQIGKHIRDALSNSTRGIRRSSVQAEWKAIQAPMLKAIGATTWIALAKGARAVALQCINDMVTIIPSANYEINGGTELRGQAVTSELQADDIGDKILGAFSASS